MAVDTRKVTGRRALRFASLDDAMRDASALAEAQDRGEARQLGNWTLGQSLGHVAYWIDAAYDGFPPELSPPGWVKFFAKFFRGQFLNGKMPSGVRLKGAPSGTFGTEPYSTPEGLARFIKACERLKSSTPTQPNLIFGPMTHEEWTKLNLRHAELHLSFFTT